MQAESDGKEKSESKLQAFGTWRGSLFYPKNKQSTSLMQKDPKKIQSLNDAKNSQTQPKMICMSPNQFYRDDRNTDQEIET